ncbi:hypothetical protein [Kingella negevensis]|uniref:hypothetical protein n=1 Tax=Kingella negevensis TaxID=1522312 RepID=UPI00254DF999|nr:hypothetical protein [Kingella negevensis]MDK4679362.1 hypothetical protein [Kingella negevensis]MDK4682918.1 hypothetical protein [Kingella negevensis]MDK4691117.1 hypothetical protein [Kingella negevensis]MDK4693735.1 hypothetical protein [Kingella negevensis]MDK4700358.1 hypothetical protein [Kingella negevensis]
MGAIIFLLVVFAPYGLAFVLGLILLFKCLGANDILAMHRLHSKNVSVAGIMLRALAR